MVGKDKPKFDASHRVTAITFLLIDIITTGILFVCTLILNQNHSAMAQQEPIGTSAQNATGITVPNSGHWIPEERPVFVIKLLNNFFSGNPTETSK